MDEVEPEDDVELATRLLAEWDEGRGTSKSEIERREWGDGGAHGRRFDRFIRQTLGVATTKRSRQTDRIADLQGQLRRLGATPDGQQLEEWEEQLDHARQAALGAVRVWNDPMATFRTETFALLFVTAWNSLALAVLQQAGDEWRDLDEGGSPRTVNGRDRALETSELVDAAFSGDRFLGLRRNVEFWLGLRNQVAHRHLPALDVAIIPQAQAGLLNLEGALEERFGSDFTLGSSLSVPLQLTGFRDPGVLSSVKRLQASLPLDVQSYLDDQASRNAALVDDPAYMLRVTFVPTVPASGRSPDAVAHFVKPGEVSEDSGGLPPGHRRRSGPERLRSDHPGSAAVYSLSRSWNGCLGPSHGVLSRAESSSSPVSSSSSRFRMSRHSSTVPLTSSGPIGTVTTSTSASKAR